MSHFSAAIPTSARRTIPTARGHKSTGISTYAASHDGKITVRLWNDGATGQDNFEVLMEPHLGHGDEELVAAGTVGKRNSIRS